MHEIHSSLGPIGQGRLQADLLSNLLSHITTTGTDGNLVTLTNCSPRKHLEDYRTKRSQASGSWEPLSDVMRLSGHRTITVVLGAQTCVCAWFGHPAGSA